MDLLVVTSNSHKTREFAALLGSNFQLRDISSLGGAPHIVESGSTFAENAIIKSLAGSRLLPDHFVIADDSGLCVDALDGAPGIFSARYAGETATDADNVQKLLAELRRAGSRDSSARFVCALAVAKDGQIIFQTEASIAGTITATPRGEHGFGYDPVFVPQGFSETFAELPAGVKNGISHRARASRNVARFLETARL
jgi:XTP/dITP diphosphohydrolase